MQKTMLALSIVALAFAACGGGAGDTPESTFEAMKSAAVGKDWGGFYDIMSPGALKEAIGPFEELRKNMGEMPDEAKEMAAKQMDLTVDELESMDARGFFIKIMDKMAEMNPKGFEEVAEQTIKETKIDGDKATVTVEGGGKTETIRMVKVDGKWYLAGFSN